MILYHGSHYEHAVLSPGFKHSGVIERWDHTESNLFLYATTDKLVACEMGFASAVAKHYALDRFQTDDHGITVTLSQKEHGVTVDDLLKLDVYLYTVKFRSADGWVLNKNNHNGLSDEFKTKKDVTGFDSVEKLSTGRGLKFLGLKKVTILISSQEQKPVCLSWQ